MSSTDFYSVTDRIHSINVFLLFAAGWNEAKSARSGRQTNSRHTSSDVKESTRFISLWTGTTFAWSQIEQLSIPESVDGKRVWASGKFESKSKAGLGFTMIHLYFCRLGVDTKARTRSTRMDRWNELWIRATAESNDAFSADCATRSTEWNWCNRHDFRW